MGFLPLWIFYYVYTGKEEPVMFDHQEELDQYLKNIEALIKNKQYARLRDLFLPMEPADIALLLEEAGEEEMPLLYRLLPKELAAEVFVELESDSQEMLINGFSNTELKEVLDELYLDDAVDIVEEMPASVVIRILDKAEADAVLKAEAARVAEWNKTLDAQK